jgi:hypothetical protein
MVKEKIYFPVSEDYNNFIGLTGSKDGLIFPIVLGEKTNFHITAYVKKRSDGGFYFNIHLTNQKDGEHTLLLDGELSKKCLKKFEIKCNNFSEEIIQLLNKYSVSVNEFDKKDLYCINCAFNNNNLPKKLNQSKLFWKNLNSQSDYELINKYVDCDNPEHSIFYDKKNKIIIYRLKNEIMVGFKDLQQFMNEFDERINNHFKDEIELCEKTMNLITKDVKSRIEK